MSSLLFIECSGWKRRSDAIGISSGKNAGGPAHGKNASAWRHVFLPGSNSHSGCQSELQGCILHSFGSYPSTKLVAVGSRSCVCDSRRGYPGYSRTKLDCVSSWLTGAESWQAGGRLSFCPVLLFQKRKGGKKKPRKQKQQGRNLNLTSRLFCSLWAENAEMQSCFQPEGADISGPGEGRRYEEKGIGKRLAEWPHHACKCISRLGRIYKALDSTGLLPW